MAAIDKIYGSTEEYDEFFAWIEGNKPEYTQYFYQRDGYKNNISRPITNFPVRVDRWLMRNCPIRWVKDRIHEQYDGWI